MIHLLTHCEAEKLVKKLLGENEVEAVLQRLDRLTDVEARTTAAEILKVVHGHIQNMNVLMEGGETRSVYHLPSVDHLYY